MRKTEIWIKLSLGNEWKGYREVIKHLLSKNLEFLNKKVSVNVAYGDLLNYDIDVELNSANDGTGISHIRFDHKFEETRVERQNQLQLSGYDDLLLRIRRVLINLAYALKAIEYCSKRKIESENKIRFNNGGQNELN